MSALKGLAQLKINSDLLNRYIDLYKLVGACEEKIKYLDSYNSEYSAIEKNEDIKHAYSMFFKDEKIKDSRINKIIKGLDLGINITKSEKLFINLKDIFDRINSNLKFNFDYVEMVDLSKLIFRGYYKEDNSFKKSDDKLTYSQRLDTMFREYKAYKETVEPLCLYTNFLVDFLKLSPFKYGNEIIGFVFFYCLILNSNIKCFRYSSFFKELSLNKEEFDKALIKSFYLYDEGYSDSSSLINFFINICENAYKMIFDLYNQLIFNKQLKKSNNVEEVIYSLNDVFSKSEIMERLPGVSMSTVDRKLKEMQEKGLISSYGTGRNAKWVLIDHSRKRGDFNDSF